MRVLVTGGAGYIGSNVVLKLKDAGHRTVVYDNLSKGHKGHIFSDEFVNGDVHNKGLLANVLKKYKIDAVMHFAAFIEAGESMQNPSKYFNNNSAGTLSLLDAMLDSDVKNFIFSSTAAVYGYPSEVPIVEEAELKPVNAYGESKLVVEKILKWYSEIYGFNYISLRYFNAAGADNGLRCGELHTPETHLIPLVIQAAYGERDSIRIYGTDYKTKDGTCIRDYIHVSDLAEAHMLALDYVMEEKRSGIFNLGCEKSYSVREIIGFVKRITGRDFNAIDSPRRPGDPDVLVASSKKIRRVLGWKPQFDGPEIIIKTAVDFYRKTKGLL